LPNNNDILISRLSGKKGEPMPYITQIDAFQPRTDSERSDKQIILDTINLIGDAILYRKSQLAHMTSSGFILNPSMTKTLMVHHNIYQTWARSGGHADGDRDLIEIAIKEAKEETGIKTINPLIEDMLSLDILTVKGHGCTEKTIFLRLLTKKRLRYCYAGAHTGTPLRLYLRYFRIFVGADRCVRPQVR